MRKTIVIIFLFLNICNAQEDTLEYYYPLSIGNLWQYKVTHYNSYDTTTLYKNTEVIKDTIIDDNLNLFYKLKAAFIVSPIGSEFQYLRYDSSSQSIIEYRQFDDEESTLFKLTADDNASWKYFGDDVCANIDTQLVFGQMNTCKNFYDCGSSPPFWSYTLSKGVGPITIVDDQSWGFLNYTTYSLVYAKIDSVEYGSFVTSINVKEQIPMHYSISQNYPNPFNPYTTINYAIPKTSHVFIIIYNAIGEEIERLVDENQSVGNYNVNFNGKNLSSGIYFYQFKAGEYLKTKKMVLIK